MDLVADQGLALVAGRNVVPKRSSLAAYSSRVEDRTPQRLPAAWFTEVQRAGLTRGSSRDLDSHAVPAHTAEEPLGQHYVPRRSRSHQGILTFLARDASQRALCCARAGITTAEQPGARLRPVASWEQQTGAPPEGLVFDSRLATSPYLDRRHRRHRQFITRRRRTRAMRARSWGRPASAWQRSTLPALTRKFRTPQVLAARVQVKGDAGERRQGTVLDLGPEDPTGLRTSTTKIRCPALVTR
jgi:hypothetical protein